MELQESGQESVLRTTYSKLHKLPSNTNIPPTSFTRVLPLPGLPSLPHAELHSTLCAGGRIYSWFLFWDDKACTGLSFSFPIYLTYQHLMGVLLDQYYLCSGVLRITSVSWIIPSTTSAVASRTIFRRVVPR